MAWTLIDLLQHPGYLNEVREEVDAVMGGGPPEEMDWRRIGALARMECAVKESERLHPVAHVALRRAVEEVRLGGRRVPQGTYVLAAPCVAHRMPEVFPDPHVYLPDRFAPGGSAAGRETDRLIGFGGGVHRCIGVNFARLEMKIVLAMLVRRYDMELLDPPRTASGTMTRWPARPARVRYAARAGDRRAPRGAAPPAAPSAAPAGCPAHLAE